MSKSVIGKIQLNNSKFKDFDNIESKFKAFDEVPEQIVETEEVDMNALDPHDLITPVKAKKKKALGGFLMKPEGAS